MSDKKLYIICLSLLLAVALGACVGSGGGTSALDDTAWRLTEINGGAPAAPATLQFDGGEGIASGNTGCNSYSGSYSVDEGKLEFGEIAMTEIGCPGEVAEQEAQFIEILSNVTSFTVDDGELLIYAGDMWMAFAPGLM